jgi:hypothetical protein
LRIQYIAFVCLSYSKRQVSPAKILFPHDLT